MRTHWVHLEFYFRPRKKISQTAFFSDKEFIEFKDFLNQVVKKCAPYIKRKFFLFEPKPHCFLALEFYPEKVKNFKKIESFKAPKFVSRTEWNFTSHDETNGEAFLNFMDGAYDIIMQKDKKFCPPWLKKHPKNKQLLIHAVHCLLNSFTCMRPEEVRFYTMMAETYSVGWKK